MFKVGDKVRVNPNVKYLNELALRFIERFEYMIEHKIVVTIIGVQGNGNNIQLRYNGSHLMFLQYNREWHGSAFRYMKHNEKDKVSK